MGPPPASSTSEAPAPAPAALGRAAPAPARTTSRAAKDPADRKRTFHASHARKFALEVVATDEATGAVTAVVCLFCRHFGREEQPGRKRKATANFKYFRSSFRTDLYAQHHNLQHPKQWARYRACSDDAKRTFFPTTTQRDWLPTAEKKALVKRQDIAQAAAAADLSPVERRCWFSLPKRIVDLVAPTSSGNVWQPLGFRACDLVPLSASPSTGADAAAADAEPAATTVQTEPYYRVALFSRSQLNVAVASLAAGLSPSQATRHATALSRCLTQSADPLPMLPHCSVAEMRDLARLAVSESLQLVGQLLARSWGFGLALRERTAAPTLAQAGYLDIRVVVYAQGRLRDVHLVALPMFERHAAFVLAQTVETVLDAVLPSWRSRLLGITQDGTVPVQGAVSTPASSSTQTPPPASHRSAELLALLEASVQTHTAAIATEPVLYRSWGACRQVTLALNTFYESLLGGGFVPVLRAVTTHIRHQPTLLQEMGHPPSVALTAGSPDAVDDSKGLELDADSNAGRRWMAMGRDTQWIMDKRVRLRKHLEQYVAAGDTSGAASSIAGSGAVPVDDVWWVAFFVVHWVSTRANEALRKLQEPRAERAQQKAVIAELAAELVMSFHVQSGGQSSTPASSTDGRQPEPPLHSHQGKFSLLKSNVREFLGDLGIFVSNVVARVAPEALEVVLENLAACLVNLVEALMELSGTFGNSSQSEARDLPPVLPHELAQLGGREFAALVQSHTRQLRAFFSEEQLDSVDQEHQALRRAATRGAELKASLAGCNELTPFTQAWQHTEGRFPLLQAFAGGLASAFVARDAGSCGEPLLGLTLGGPPASAGDGSGDETLRVPVAALALEATLHAQQVDALGALVVAPESAADPATVSI